MAAHAPAARSLTPPALLQLPPPPAAREARCLGGAAPAHRPPHRRARSAKGTDHRSHNSPPPSLRLQNPHPHTPPPACLTIRPAFISYHISQVGLVKQLKLVLSFEEYTRRSQTPAQTPVAPGPPDAQEREARRPPVITTSLIPASLSSHPLSRPVPLAVARCACMIGGGCSAAHSAGLCRGGRRGCALRPAPPRRRARSPPRALGPRALPRTFLATATEIARGNGRGNERGRGATGALGEGGYTRGGTRAARGGTGVWRGACTGGGPRSCHAATQPRSLFFTWSERRMCLRRMHHGGYYGGGPPGVPGMGMGGRQSPHQPPMPPGMLQRVGSGTHHGPIVMGVMGGPGGPPQHGRFGAGGLGGNHPFSGGGGGPPGQGGPGGGGYGSGQ